MARNSEKEVRCSFCGKPQSVVDRLIAGQEAFICGDCIGLCYDLVHGAMFADDDMDFDAAAEFDLDADDLPTPMEMKERLDEYIIGQDKAKIALSVAVYNHYKRILYGDLSDVELQKSSTTDSMQSEPT